MSEERPLHVHVAEALGWTRIERQHHGGDRIPLSEWWGDRPANDHVYGGVAGVAFYAVPRFDTSWSATGPLIERFSIDLRCSKWTNGIEWEATVWLPNPDPVDVKHVKGPTPLVAVCNLIIALAAAGKLPKE